MWESLAQHVPERARWIEEMGAALGVADERRRLAVEAQLVVMVSEAACIGRSVGHPYFMVQGRCSWWSW